MLPLLMTAAAGNVEFTTETDPVIFVETNELPVELVCAGSVMNAMFPATNVDPEYTPLKN
jgi:hypothetical protein